MGLILKSYTRKPPAGVQPPNWSRIGLPVPVAWMPLNEGAGVPHAWINGVRRAPSTNSLTSNAAWRLGQWGLEFRPTTANEESFLVWDNFPALGSGDFTALAAMTTGSSAGGGGVLSASQYKPGYIYTNNSKCESYINGYTSSATAFGANEDVVFWTERDGNTAAVEFSESRVIEGYASSTKGSNQNGVTFNFNAGSTTGNGARATFIYYYVALWHEVIPVTIKDQLLRDPDLIWQIYSSHFRHLYQR